MRAIARPSSKFLKVACGKCKNEQVIFSSPSQDVHCLVCNGTLSEKSGGKGKIKARVLQTMD